MKNFKLLLLSLVLAVLMMAWSETGYTQEAKEKLPSDKEFVAVEILPEMIYEEVPVYPPEAEEKKIEGIVYIRALVDKTGKVLDAKVEKTCGTEQLDKAAVEAAYKCKYKPAIQKGKPVATWVTYKVDFKLSDEDCVEAEKK